MIPMRMMEVPVYQVIQMITVGDRFVPAARTVSMARTFDCGRAGHGVSSVDRDDMLVSMIHVHMM